MADATNQAIASSPPVLSSAPWPKLFHDLQNTSRSPLPGPRHGKLVWRTLVTEQYGGMHVKPPVVDSNGTVYTVSYNGILFCTSAQGRVQWNYFVEGGPALPVLGSDGQIYFATPSGTLVVYNRSGKLIQKVAISGRSPVICTSPILAKPGRLYLCCRPDVRDVPPYSDVFAVRIPEGAIAWRARVPGTINWAGFDQPCLAVAKTGDVYVSTTQGLHCLADQGDRATLRWSFPLHGGWSRPLILDDGTLVVAGVIEDKQKQAQGFLGEQYYLYAISPGGKLKWRVPNDGPPIPVVGPGNRIYVGGSAGVHALTAGGRPVWSFHNRNDGGRPEVIDRDGNVYVSFAGGSFYALSRDGKVRWRLRIPMEGIGHLALGPGRRLYVAGDDKYLYAIE